MSSVGALTTRGLESGSAQVYCRAHARAIARVPMDTRLPRPPSRCEHSHGRELFAACVGLPGALA
eukprot:1500239-Pyramimonas_sp.AAC.1